MDALKRESPDEEELRKIFQELEFRTLLERIFKEKPKEAPAATPGQGDLFGFLRPRLRANLKNESRNASYAKL